jgi:hypothetical protein
VGCMVRANDKMKRLQTFAIKGSLANESVEDSLLDLAVYAIIGLQLFREQSEPAKEVHRSPWTALCTCPHPLGLHFNYIGEGALLRCSFNGCPCEMEYR